MPFKIGMISLLLLSLLGCLSSDTTDQSDQPADGVGFKLIELWDQSRPYRASHAPDGTPAKLPAGRPLQIAVWYPAVIGERSPLTVGDYIDLGATENTLQPMTEQRSRAARTHHGDL